MTILRVEKSNPEYSPKNTTTLTLHSSHIKGRQDIRVYHQPTEQKNLPIVMLLHGVYGASHVWMDLGGAHQVYDTLRAQGICEFVLVMPSDGGLWDGSAYLPLASHGNYEQWIVDDVIQGVKAHIDGVGEQSRCYVTGLSMGGYGALRLGAKYPSLFAGVSAHSSVTSLSNLQQFIENPVSDYVCQDKNEADITYWLEKNRETIPPLRFDCGKEDSLYASNLSLCNTLDALKISYQFDAFSGGHEWAYWHEHLAQTLTFFADIESKT